MKIKLDFVSNSSSSSYVITFPEKVNIHNIVNNYIDCKYSYFEDDEKKDLTEKLEECLNNLNDGSEIWQEDSETPDYLDHSIFCEIEDFIHHEKIILVQLDTSPDRGQIVGVKINEIKKIIERIQ